MRTVRLRTKQSIGPLTVTRRAMTPEGYRKEVYEWSFDNGFTQTLPVEYWESLKGEFLDRRANIRYSDAIIEL